MGTSGILVAIRVVNG